jgi:hypothetical protein
MAKSGDISPKDVQLVFQMLELEPRNPEARTARKKLDTALQEFLTYSSAWGGLLSAAKEYQVVTAPPPQRPKRVHKGTHKPNKANYRPVFNIGDE